MVLEVKRTELIRQRQKRRKARRRRRLIIFALLPLLVLLFFIGFNADRQKNIVNNGVPLLLQTDSRWNDLPYGSSTIGISGCAPTCLAMVAEAITGNQELTPDVIAEFAEKNDYYVEGTGTKWTLMTDGAKKFGLKARELALDEGLVTRELMNHHPIICSVGPGDFTTEGHFIVLASYDNGRIRVNDPNSVRNSQAIWNYERLASQISAMWVYK